MNPSGAAQLALAGHTHRAPLRNSNSARLNLPMDSSNLSGAEGEKNKTEKTGELCSLCRAEPDINNCNKIRARSAHKTAFHFPCAPPSSAEWSGDFGEDCLSTWTRSGSCEFRSRLTRRATQGTAKRRQTGVAFFLVTFSLAKQEKVSSCRATPGGFAFDSHIHTLAKEERDNDPRLTILERCLLKDDCLWI